MIQRSGETFAMPEMNLEKIPEAIQSGLRSSREMIEEYPATAVFAAFGVGLGMGVGLAVLMGCSSMFSPPPARHRYW